MSWRKTLVQTKFMPRNLSRIEQGHMWIFTNKMVFGAGLFTVAHNGKIYYFVKKRDTPKFRYRALAQAAKLYLRSKFVGKDVAIALGFKNPSGVKP